MSDVSEFLAQITPQRRFDEAQTLNALFQRVTGFQPQFYKGGMLGYGLYDYTYKTGHSGTSFATGFAPRKAKLSIYIMPGYQDYSAILDRLGKHSKGAACLYLNKLADADLDVLAELITTGLRDLNEIWPVRPT